MGLPETAGSPKYLEGIGAPVFFAGMSGTGRITRQMETAMLDSVRNLIVSCRKQLIAIAVSALLMAPSAGKAEPLLLLNDPLPEAVRQRAGRSVDIGLNTNGDLVIRRGIIALTVAYNPPDEFIEPQERIRIIQRQDCPAISGVSVKVSLLF